MTKKQSDLAELLIFNFVLDTRCVSSKDFEKALDILIAKTEEAKLKLLNN